ncbi:MAG: type II secretion system protein N [Neisseriaceae bacterium]|jgi:hypothetical protein
MSRLNRFYTRYKKIFITSIFIIIFLIAFINNIPSWVLGSALDKYSQHKLKLYDTQGTFWSGSGLLVATDSKTQSAPLILLNWSVALGFSKFVDVKFFVGNNQLVDIYLNKQGLYLDSLNMSLSMGQVTQLFGLIKNLGLSGNINMSSKQVHLGTKNEGIFNIKLTSVSSSISPVNPLGDYNINFDTGSGAIQVSSDNNSSLLLSGSGSLNSLILSGRIAPSKKDKLLQFMTIMGLPQPDGSYSLKIF